MLYLFLWHSAAVAFSEGSMLRLAAQAGTYTNKPAMPTRTCMSGTPPRLSLPRAAAMCRRNSSTSLKAGICGAGWSNIGPLGQTRNGPGQGQIKFVCAMPDRLIWDPKLLQGPVKFGQSWSNHQGLSYTRQLIRSNPQRPDAQCSQTWSNLVNNAHTRHVAMARHQTANQDRQQDQQCTASLLGVMHSITGGVAGVVEASPSTGYDD